MSRYDYILAKSEDAQVSLSQHLRDVADAAFRIAEYLGLNPETARKGALLHDIGKVSSQFQATLKKDYRPRPNFFFRHEIASLFFLSLVSEEEIPAVIEMIAAHHKSLKDDVRELGFLDLEDSSDSFGRHSKDFSSWVDLALGILEECGMAIHPISLDEARDNYEKALAYCQELDSGYSIWKGVLMAADHLASAFGEKIEYVLPKLFIKPDLSFYSRANGLYPLSTLSVEDKRPHTLVTAPTGAGKTDFLLRRCKGRVFYTLPFQASINAMYDRIKADLSATPAQIHLLHATSNLKIKKKGTKEEVEERIIQRHLGASVKILTPHQMASIVFGIKGYEAMITDLKGCDVILDEIHTYSDIIQAIVWRIVEILVNLGCRIHIGTATMPTVLYNKLLDLLGGAQNVYEVKLDNKTLASFNRHIIHKKQSFDECIPVMDAAVERKEKILVVCNQVRRAQDLYGRLKSLYPGVQMMLIHSRFKRGHRQQAEWQLKQVFNTMNEACIVVSTQVVEVSLDISFDLMLTECATIDALIQRFGRINRKRTQATIGKYKPICVLVPPQDEKDAKPYQQAVLQRSFDILPDNDLLREDKVQEMLDYVYPEIAITDIDYSGATFADGEWQIGKLVHKAKSVLLEKMEIDSAICITESDKDAYRNGRKTDIQEYEIPVNYHSIGHRNLEQLREGMRPFLIPDKAYSEELGLLMDFLSSGYAQTFEII
ncbi:MAG: CRISPR-associated helicase Cas3' [Bacteroides sp.]|nr:CRISPR-associated helicase Cas3' [Ruminococcus flavefaciens]MCM1555180.1 CRISPR-associated helicase Cas3' [Bacteroides sp.]